MDWPTEQIPDEDQLYYRVHKTYLRLDEIEPAAFTACFLPKVLSTLPAPHSR
jgi:hypothetical protein